MDQLRRRHDCQSGGVVALGDGLTHAADLPEGNEYRPLEGGEEARLGFQQTLLNAGSEVNEALVQYQTATEKTDYYARQVESLGRALESTSLLMTHGNTTYLEVLTAQQSLLNAQLTQVANRFAQIQGLINLYHALGGGTV